MNINKYMSDSIKMMAKTALRFAFGSAREFAFITRMIPKLRNDSVKRDDMDKNGLHVPPFLIASISARCNLHCSGCYARATGGCSDAERPDELTAEQWSGIFTQAEELGVSFILLAGGEPLMRRDVINAAARHSGIIFPILTNGTLVDAEYLELFNRHRNLLPVISLEGGEAATDARRGAGITLSINNTMREFKAKGIFFGVSITVTSANLEEVSSSEFVGSLHKRGCGLVLFVEYVPLDEQSAHLTLEPDACEFLVKRKETLTNEFSNTLFICFPGDEQFMGGCLAAGRGFFHINPTGGAEPCPFSPYSDRNLKNFTLAEALSSPLFQRLRSSGILSQPHKGGCVLFEHKDTVQSLTE